MARKAPPPKAPKRMFIRPKLVDVGRGPEPAVLTFQRSKGRWVRVSPEGGLVIWEGREKRFWQRRIKEGAAEIVEQTADVLASEKPPKQRKPKSEQEN